MSTSLVNNKVGIARQSKLFPDEPHYIPGYRGYCPQINFKMGDTYGKTTNVILTDNSIAKSARRVLAQTHTNNSATNIDKVHVSRNRRAISFGDKKLTNDMVPGYTGYIPKKEEHFGTRYAIGCHRAICDFEDDRNTYSNYQAARVHAAETSKQEAQRREAAPYVSVKQAQHSVSPYFMETGDSGKTFMSGYTGFIPYSRAHFANVYPVMTKTALTAFTEDRAKMKKVANQKVNVKKLQESTTHKPHLKVKPMTHSIYRNKEGLLPRYTGYLPGHKYRYGVTFGTSARYYHTHI